MFKSEQDCIDYLVSLRWPNGFECPNVAQFDSGRRTKGDMNAPIVIKKLQLQTIPCFTKVPSLYWFGSMPYGGWLLRKMALAQKDYKSTRAR